MVITQDAPGGAHSAELLFNEGGQLTNFARPDGQSLEMLYDERGFMTDVSWADDHYTYLRDDDGRLASIWTESGEATAYYQDGESQRAVITGSVSGELQWGGSVTGETPYLRINGEETTKAFDAWRRLVGVGDLSLERDAFSGRVDARQLGRIREELTYTPFGQVKRRAVYRDNVLLYNFRYSYNDRGNLVSRGDRKRGRAWRDFQFAYDERGRLMETREEEVLTARYSYDTGNNRYTESLNSDAAPLYSYAAGDRLMQAGSMRYSYGEAGDRSESLDTSSEERTRFQYDLFGNLREVQLPNDSVIEYRIDAANRRVARIKDGVFDYGFLYLSGHRPVARVNEDGDVLATYHYTGERLAPSFMKKDGRSYLFICDEVGAVRLVVDSETGTIVQRMDYDAWGQITYDSNPGFQPFAFGGGIYDADTGLTRLGARDYDAAVGRWTTPDPIGPASGQANFYAYVQNNPVNFTDPSGLKIPKPEDLHPFDREAMKILSICPGLKDIISAMKKHDEFSLDFNDPQHSSINNQPWDVSVYEQAKVKGGAVTDCKSTYCSIAVDLETLAAEQSLLTYAEAIAHELGHSYDFFELTYVGVTICKA